jgi:predicted RNA-binding Zn-ribbon protein involved in translation (DUF1610 family)
VAVWTRGGGSPKMTRMQAVGVELVTTCRACEASIAINGIVSSAACPKCARVIDLDARLWQEISSTVIATVAPRSVGFELTATFTSGPQTFHAVLRRVTMPANLASRPAPEGLMDARVSSVAGEDLESMRIETATSVRIVRCPACGAPLEAAHDARDLLCKYCGNESLLEGERVVGRPVRRFHLACAVAEQPASANVWWEHVDAVTVDEADRVFVLGGTKSSGSAVFALDPTLTHVRWMKAGFELVKDDAQLVARRDRVVLVHGKGAPPRLLDAADGESRGTLPPAGTKGLRFDPLHVRTLAPAPDGGWLASVDGGQLVTWGGAWRPPPEMENGRRPIDVVPGFDGSMLLTNGATLVHVSARGIVTSLQHPDGVSWKPRLLALDGLNRVHALTDSDVKHGAYIALDVNGARMRNVARHGSARLLGKERRIAAANAGGVVLVGFGGRLRMIRPDGTLGYVSPQCAEDDRAIA